MVASQNSKNSLILLSEKNLHCSKTELCRETIKLGQIVGLGPLVTLGQERWHRPDRDGSYRKTLLASIQEDRYTQDNVQPTSKRIHITQRLYQPTWERIDIIQRLYQPTSERIDITQRLYLPASMRIDINQRLVSQHLRGYI